MRTGLQSFLVLAEDGGPSAVAHRLTVTMSLAVLLVTDAMASNPGARRWLAVRNIAAAAPSQIWPAQLADGMANRQALVPVLTGRGAMCYAPGQVAG
jgi:hypothetical protein